jgi:hypothetical protein
MRLRAAYGLWFAYFNFCRMHVARYACDGSQNR